MPKRREQLRHPEGGDGDDPVRAERRHVERRRDEAVALEPVGGQGTLSTISASSSQILAE
jgi:hypothetical protein